MYDHDRTIRSGQECRMDIAIAERLMDFRSLKDAQAKGQGARNNQLDGVSTGTGGSCFVRRDRRA